MVSNNKPTPKKILHLKILNNVYSEVLKGVQYIIPILSYEAVYWKKMGHQKKKITYQKVLIEKNRFLYSGWLDKIKNHCEENNIYLVFDGEENLTKLIPTNEPYLPGIEFREYQKETIDIVLKKQRGCCIFPTGSGKTILAAGIISCFKNSKVLFLVPTIDLLSQTREEFEKFGLNVSICGKGEKDISGDIVVGTIQTLSKMNLDKIKNLFDIYIQDEGHLAIGENSTVSKIARAILSPIRILLTATYPDDEEKKLYMGGLFGDKIASMDYSEAKKEKIVTNAKVRIIEVPKIKGLEKLINEQKNKDIENNKKIKQKINLEKDKNKIKKLEKLITNKTQYQLINKVALVENYYRNNLIVDEAIRLNEQGLSTIIFVTMLDHVKNISEILKERRISHECVYGEISGDERTRIKNKLKNKELLLIVSSVVFKTGLDIKSLDSVIITCGRSASTLIQTVGRALRTDKGKNISVIVDFIDPHVKYLSDHGKERLKIYEEMGWID